MGFRDLLQSFMREGSLTWASFGIASDHVIDGEVVPPETDRFVPERTYLEIRLSELHLRDRREYWQEFIPLASFMVELLYDGTRRSVPFVVGPELMQGAEHVGAGDRIEYYNTRVAGPYPYLGDDVNLFAGLFRMESGNWAKRALSLLESMGKLTDATRLSSYLPIAGPLVEGVQQVLGMKEVEPRLAQRRQLSQPPDDGGPIPPSSNTLRPGYQVWLRIPQSDMTDAERKRFWVKEGKLHHGDDPSSVRPFENADFLLIRLTALLRRSDHSTFAFHRHYWPKIKDHIWEGRASEAEATFKLLASQLAESEDIIFDHRLALLKSYRKSMEAEAEAYEELVLRGGQGFEDAGRAPGALGEPELTSELSVDPDRPVIPSRSAAGLLNAVGI